MAKLDAEAGAPSPLPEILFSLTRVDPWRPRKAARYIIGFGRKIDVREGLTSELEVDGRMRQVRVETVRAESDRRTRLAVGVATVVICLTLVIAAITTGLDRKSVTEASLQRAEISLAISAARKRRAIEAKRQQVVLSKAGVTNAALGAVLEDLAGVAKRRSGDATIDSITWNSGEMRAETRGSATPLADARKLGRSPDHPNNFLWALPSLHADPDRS